MRTVPQPVQLTLFNLDRLPLAPVTPFGYCECGCGQKTTLALQTRRRLHLRKGDPIRYLPGHQRYKGPVARFWGFVIKTDGCWGWRGPRMVCDRRGKTYGRLPLDGRFVLAHRFSYELHYGPIPAGCFVCHHCDTPECSRPDHLFLGTAADNMADAVAKGRHAHGARHGSRTRPERVPRGERHGSRQHPERFPRGDVHYARTHPERLARGERNAAAKLTDEQVRAIRATYAGGGTSLRLLALAYGVSTATIGKITSRTLWRHVT